MNTSKKKIVAAAALVIGLSACAGTPTGSGPASTSPTAIAPSSAPTATDAADNPFPGYLQRKARNGETLYCREDEVAGTRIPKLVCATEYVLRNQSVEAHKQVNDMRQTAGQGGCNPAEGC